MRHFKLLQIFLCMLVIFGEVFACTGISLRAQDGSVINGRTVEFGSPIEMSVAVIPRNYDFVGEIPEGRGRRYRSKYAAAGIYCFTDKKLMDGINEKGLVAAAFYFTDYAQYTEITSSNRLQALSPVEFPNWILSQFATVDEVKQALTSVVIAPTVFKAWGSTPPPLHYVVYDRTGKCIVIEPIKGHLRVYDNPLGVITNSPPFDWQTTNLGNYVNLTPFNHESMMLKNLLIKAFGQGSGMLGLPGDFTPPSRFIRAAFFSAFATASQNSDEAVDQMFHLLNPFDIPYGAVREKNNHKVSFDYTMLTSVKNPHTLRYYYRSYADQSIRFIDLHQFNLSSREIKDMKIEGKQQTLDVSSQLR